MSYQPQVFSQTPVSNSNWVLLHKKTFNNEPIGNYSVPIQGDKYDRLKLIAKYNTSESISSLNLRFNNDNSNYTRLNQYGGGLHGSNEILNDTDILITTANQKSAICEYLITPKSGSTRSVIGQLGYVRNTNNNAIQHEYYDWNNTTDEITSLDFYDSQGSVNVNLTIEIYAWQDIKAIDLHSYELVKEYNLDNELLDDTIPWDGEIDEDLYIVSNIKTADASRGLRLRFNNDLGNNYCYQFYYAYGADSYVKHVINNSYDAVYVSMNCENGSMTTFNANLKSGSYRFFNSVSGVNRTSTLLNNLNIIGGCWSNSVDPITSLTFFGQDNTTLTGNIKVYKLVKTQILKQQTNPVELVHNAEYNNESINLDIDLTDCDELEITASTDINLANSVLIYFNNDTTTSNYTRRIIQNDFTTEGTSDPLLLSTSNTRESTKMYVDKKAKTIYGRYNRRNTSGTYYLQEAFYMWTSASDATSVKITTTGFTGILKIWKKY